MVSPKVPYAGGTCFASKVPGDRIYRKTTGHSALSDIAKAIRDNGMLRATDHRVRFKLLTSTHRVARPSPSPDSRTFTARTSTCEVYRQNAEWPSPVKRRYRYLGIGQKSRHKRILPID